MPSPLVRSRIPLYQLDESPAVQDIVMPCTR